MPTLRPHKRRRDTRAVGRVVQPLVERLDARLLFATYMVTSTANAGAGTLRQAMLDANANPGTDSIHFNLAGAGPFLIAPTTALPALSETVHLDGRTQPGYTNAPRVDIRGPGGSDSIGLKFDGDGSSIRGLSVTYWATAIIVNSNHTVVAGNFVGVIPNGTFALGGMFSGVQVVGNDNLVGGLTAADRNVVGAYGMGINLAGHRNKVQGNYIGIMADGSTKSGGNIGIGASNSHDALIGGTVPAARNVITGQDSAIQMHAGTGSNPTIQGNYIGTDSTGMLPRGSMYGIHTDFDGPMLIGGTEPGAGNLIAASGMHGIYLTSANATAAGSGVIQGNRIGVNAQGGVLGNGYAGIRLQNSSGFLIGGTLPDAANEIANNGWSGIALASSRSVPNPVNNRILGNSIYDNSGSSSSGWGIDSENSAGLTRDLFDADTGANGSQNAPYITSVTAEGTGHVAAIRLTSAPSSTYRIEVFRTIKPAGISIGQGRYLLAVVEALLTDATGEAVVNVPLTGLPSGWHVTATATGVDGTSTFSEPVAIGGIGGGYQLAPSEPVLAPESDTGVSDSDRITRDTLPLLTGVAPAGATVEVFANATSIGTTVADANNRYSIRPTTPLADAEYSMFARSQLPSAPSSPASARGYMTVDTIGPGPSFSFSPTPMPAGGPRHVFIRWNDFVQGLQPGAIQLFRDGISVLPGDYLPPTVSSIDALLTRIDQYLTLTGEYTLSVPAAAVYDHTGNPSLAGSLTFPVTATGTVTVSTDRPTAVEAGAAGRFTFTRNASTGVPLTSPLTVQLELGDPSVPNPATPGDDYAALPTSITFPADVSTITLDVTALADAVTDPNETVTVRVLPPTNFVVGGSGLATVTITEPAPTVSAAAPTGGSPQRSMVNGMTVTFGVPVVPEAGAFVLSRRDGTPTGLSLAWSVPAGGDGSTWSVTFANADGSPLPGGSVPDGVYDLTIVAAKVRAGSAAGPTMSADVAASFHRLFGDADGDGDVDGADSRGFRTALGAEPGSPLYNALFDFDGDGDVDGTDSREFRTRLGTSLTEPDATDP